MMTQKKEEEMADSARSAREPLHFTVNADNTNPLSISASGAVGPAANWDGGAISLIVTNAEETSIGNLRPTHVCEKGHEGWPTDLAVTVKGLEASFCVTCFAEWLHANIPKLERKQSGVSEGREARP